MRDCRSNSAVFLAIRAVSYTHLLSWLKFNERVLNEAGNPGVPLAERLTFAAIYQSNLDEFYRVRVGTLMDQMEASEAVSYTHLVSDEELTAEYILPAAFDPRVKDAVAKAVAEAARKSGVARI